MSKKNKEKVIPAIDNSAVQQNSDIIVAETENQKVVDSESQKVKAPVVEKNDDKKGSKEITDKTTKKSKKEKRQSKFGRRLKETGSELKKVTWPTFPKVAKQTGIVLGVVVFFGVVLFAFDYLLKFLFGLLV